MKTESIDQHQIVPCKGAESRNWYAWLDTQPPKPDWLYVVGEVQVGNPGIEAILRKRHPQGINPEILLLDLFLVQKPGIWPRVVAWVPARYDEIIPRGNDCPYNEVSIFCGDEIIATVPVEIIS